MDRILIDTPATIYGTFYADGVATDPSPATATVTLTSDDGTVIQASTSATRISAGLFGYSLSARSSVDIITAAWTSSLGTVTTTFEVVGGYYASIAEIQDADASLSSYTSAQIDAARAEAEDEAERIMGRAFVSRYRRDKNLRVGSDGCVRTRMAHVTSIRAVSATSWGDAATISTTDCKIVGDDIVYTGLPCGSLVSLAYVHGGLEVPPYEVVQKGILVRARQIAQRASSAVPASIDPQYVPSAYGSAPPAMPTSSATGANIADAVYAAHSLRVGIA